MRDCLFHYHVWKGSAIVDIQYVLDSERMFGLRYFSFSANALFRSVKSAAESFAYDLKHSEHKRHFTGVVFRISNIPAGFVETIVKKTV